MFVYTDRVGLATLGISIRYNVDFVYSSTFKFTVYTHVQSWGFFTCFSKTLNWFECFNAGKIERSGLECLLKDFNQTFDCSGTRKTFFTLFEVSVNNLG